MHDKAFDLLGQRRFLPLFVTQFLGALNDNVFKNALVILVTYKAAAAAGMNGQIMATIAAGLFILPFFLFSATAGRFADKFEKSKLIAAIKLCEIAIMGLAVWGFLNNNLPLLFGVVFLMGLHSTFFGPVKYGILPDHLGRDELLAGNGLIEAGTFLAILIGTIAGGIAILAADGPIVISITIMAVAVLGFLVSLFIPRAAPAAPNLPYGLNIVAATREMLSYAGHRRDLFLSILGISWFWLVGATFLSQFPTYAKDTLGADEHVVTLFLTVFSVGIGIGSILCNRLLKGEVSAKLVPFAALGMTIFMIDLYFASSHSQPGGALLTVSDYIARPSSWRVLIDLVLIAACGGLFIVPLYAILQARSEESHRSRVIAANNIVNALFMVAASVATVGLLALHFTVPQVFLVVAVANLGVAIYICKLLPDELVKGALATILKLAYRVEVRGVENYTAAGERAVIVVNHVSFLDAVLIAAFLPGKPIFAINTYIAQRWWVKPFLILVEAFPLDPTNPLALKSLVRRLEQGGKCVIFPEGRITVTGALMKVYEGPGMIAEKARAMLVPIRIDGAQFTPFSRLKGKVRVRWFPKITITVLEPRKLTVPDALVGRARRREIGRRLYDVMTDLIFSTCNYRQTLFQAVLEGSYLHGGARIVVEDVERKPLTYRRLIASSFALGKRLASMTAPRERVGVMLPNSVGAAVTFFALQAYGSVPALLNFSTGPAALKAACKAAEIKMILTSRRFIQMAKLEPLMEQLSTEAGFVYLEDLRAQMGLGDKIWGLIAGWTAARSYARTSGNAGPDDPAVVLFTSGSEGTPKGVVLSHANILANRHQLGAVVDFNPTDIVFNALPIFHSFGLTGGLLLPILAGLKTFLYPSPLHYRIVPELVYDTNATIMFGTDTFLAGYARSANGYDFYSVRYVFAGAERVKDETRRAWTDKFGLRLLEGYGATETAPAIATNTPMQFKRGTVGRFLPGIERKLEPVPGIERGGRLSVHGPNVMLGYLRAEHPGKLEKPEGGWYDTGDIVDVDDEGFITILGRAKRFAKIAGEMVPLGRVEDIAALAWPGKTHAVVAVPDARKGEALILVTDYETPDRQSLLATAQKEGVPELFVPRVIVTVPKVPLLGTGKTDYPGVRKLADEALKQPTSVATSE